MFSSVQPCDVGFTFTVVLGERDVPLHCCNVYCRQGHLSSHILKPERGVGSNWLTGSHCGMSEQQDQLIKMTRKNGPEMSSLICILQTAFISKLWDCRLELAENLLLSQNLPSLHACKLIFSLTQFSARIEFLQGI